MAEGRSINMSRASSSHATRPQSETPSAIAIDAHSALTSFGPVVTSPTLTKNEVVGTEKVTKGTRADRVHGSGLEIN